MCADAVSSFLIPILPLNRVDPASHPPWHSIHLFGPNCLDINMSLASPSSPSSARSELHFAIDDMPVPQRPIERMSSYPSLSHSSTTATSDDVHDQLNAALQTPTDLVYSVDIGTRDDVEVLSPVAERKGGFRGLTKSMQSLRGRAKADKERSRSTSRERPPMPVLEPYVHLLYCRVS